MVDSQITNDKIRKTLYVLAISNYLLFLGGLSRSFWLDECGTAWITAGGLGEFIPRTLLLLHGPFFGAISTFSATLFGVNEYALRLPAGIAAGASLLLFFRLCQELLDPEDVHIAFALFSVWPTMSFVASEARPYGLALAFLCATYLYLVRAMRQGKMIDWIIFSISLVLLIYTQLLFIYCSGIVLLLVGINWRSMEPVARRYAIYASGVILISLVPLIYHFQVLLTAGRKYSFAELPSFKEVWQFTAPILPWQAIGGLCAVSVVLIGARVSTKILERDRFTLAFCAISGVIPILLLFVGSRLSGSGMFLERYLLPAVPAVVVFWSWLMGRVHPPFVRYVCCIFVLIYILALRIAFSGGVSGSDDWRSALTRASQLADAQNGALVLYSGFVESRDPSKYIGATQDSYLFAPLAAYPVKANYYLTLPFDLDGEARNYWHSSFQSQISRHSSFTVVLRGFKDGQRWSRFLMESGRQNGYQLQNKEMFGSDGTMVLLHFKRA